MSALLSLSWSGILPSQLCTMTQLTSLYIWYAGGSSTNPHITCTRSCLSTKTGMSYAPAGMSQCPTAMDIGLCAFIAATNIASISGYSAWQCTAAHTVVTLPCDGGTTVWTGVSCSSTGDVMGIALNAVGISGMKTLIGCVMRLSPVSLSMIIRACVCL